MFYKGGAILTLENLVGLVLVLIIMIPIFQYFELLPRVFEKSKTIPEQDMDRVLKVLTTLSSEEEVEVYANGNNYDIALYNEKDSPKTCGEYSCICVQEREKLPSCEIITSLTSNCELNKPCISKSSVYKVVYEEGKGRAMIPLCSKNNAIKIGKC